MIQLIKQLEKRSTMDYNITIGALYIAMIVAVVAVVIGITNNA